jgi:hypothetical protein
MIINSDLHIPKISNERVEIQSSTTETVILGLTYLLTEKTNLNEINSNMERHFNSIIWFSYRRNFPILKPIEGNNGFISDTK